MLITVAMAVHNGEPYLKEAIDSIRAQSHRRMEVIIVNDGSTDGTKKLLDRIDDPRFRIVHLKRNRGAAKALNKAIRLAKGDWVAIHDADDISRPDRLAAQAKHIRRHPEQVAVGTLVRCIPGQEPVPDRLLRKTERLFNSFVTPEQIRKGRFSACPLCHGSVMFSRKAFKQAEGYDPRYKIAYDYDLWTRLLDLGPIGKVRKVLYHYRIHPTSLSNKRWTDTYDEKIRSTLVSIRRVCYGDKAGGPALAFMAPEWLRRNMEDKIVPETGCTVPLFISEQFREHVPELAERIRSGELDGVLISVLLNKVLVRNLIQAFESAGLRNNENVFKC